MALQDLTNAKPSTKYDPEFDICQILAAISQHVEN